MKVRVWWIPQVPMEPFQVEVPDIKTAQLICDVLADYDDFQFKKKIKPDYCSTGGIEIFENGEWVGIDEDELEDV